MSQRRSLTRVALSTTEVTPPGLAVLGGAGAIPAPTPVGNKRLFIRFRIEVIDPGKPTERYVDVLQYLAADTRVHASPHWTTAAGDGKFFLVELDPTAVNSDADGAVITICREALLVDNGKESPSNLGGISVFDSYRDGQRIADQTSTNDIALKVGYFYDTTRPAEPAYHTVDVNLVATYNGKSLIFDPLIIIVPKRP